jgi:hypothetical protein
MFASKPNHTTIETKDLFLCLKVIIGDGGFMIMIIADIFHHN